MLLFILLLVQVAFFLTCIGVIAYMLVILYLSQRGANYVPTPKPVIKNALSVLKKGDAFVDLGFGNGEVLQAAARNGASFVAGYELDFTRFFRTWLKLRQDIRYTYHLRYGDIWSADLSRADVVYTFFTDIHMKKLYEKAKREMQKGTWFISYVHVVPGIKPTKQMGEVRFYRM